MRSCFKGVCNLSYETWMVNLDGGEHERSQSCN